MSKPKQKPDGKVREYEFTVYMCGVGKTAQEAWTDAAERAISDTGDFCNTSNLPEYKVGDVTEDQ